MKMTKLKNQRRIAGAWMMVGNMVESSVDRGRHIELNITLVSGTL